MGYWQNHKLFGPSRSMHLPVLTWSKRTLRKRFRARRGDHRHNRPKWVWWPKYVLDRKPSLRTRMRNDNFMRQLDRCKRLIRPPHLRRKKA